MVYALVVIYNKRCEESETLKELINYKNKIKIIVFDNSTKKNNNNNYCKKNNITYYSLGMNLGLSKAYNYVIDKIDYNDNDYLIILDDDTLLNEAYFDEMFMEIKNNTSDVLLPIVMSNKQIISPSKVQFGCRVKEIKKVNTISMDKITAINSGMIVKMNVFKKIRYEEDIFLDYVDHAFMRNVREQKFKIKVLKTIINQNFSRNEKQKIENVRFRFNIYKRDFKKYCYICDKKALYYLNISKYRIKNFLKYKEII